MVDRKCTEMLPGPFPEFWAGPGDEAKNMCGVAFFSEVVQFIVG